MQNQGTHWVDKIVKDVLAWQRENEIPLLHVDDMKTPSGRVHTGALRGVLLHDIVHKALLPEQPTAVNTYVFNDMDAMDSLPGYLDKSVYEQHMGKPLHQIPAPPLDKSGVDFSNASDAQKELYANAKSFAEFYALDFIEAFQKLGATPELVWSHELYESGQMDDIIRTILDNVKKFRKIYKEVADYNLPEKWFPFQVICPNCGKVGSTLVTDWDGREVTYECQPNKVEWAVGCGHSGSVSPFGGTGKLLWKADWPAHWQLLGINVEGAGKDHTSAGGSRDMANAIVKDVFDTIPPFDIPYEWILIRGTKMSSSKGIGTSAREFVELFPTEIGRYLFVSRHFNQVIDFDPATMSIPDLFDEYDQASRIFWKQEEGDQRMARSYELSQMEISPTSGRELKMSKANPEREGSSPEREGFAPRFRDVALWMQYPELDLLEKFAEVKGAPLTEDEIALLEQRKLYARIWIDRYAPTDFQFTPREEVPEKASELTDEQIKYLQAVEELIATKSNWDPQDLQQAMFDLAKQSLGAKPAFQAVYLAYLGKTSGPRASWFLLSMSTEFREKRMQQLSQTRSEQTTTVGTEAQSDQLDPKVRETFPGIFFAQVEIKNVSIKKSKDELETRKQDVLRNREGITNEEIGKIPAIQEYRKLLKATGTDWHSKRPSPEALLRRISQGKDLYSVNTAVDAYNLAVIETGIGLGGFNADKLALPISLRFSKEGESMHLLGDKEPIKTREGQLVYADQDKPVTIDLNYRDIDETKITDDTKNIMLYADGAPGLTEQEVVDALQKGAQYIQQFCGGEVGEIEVVR